MGLKFNSPVVIMADLIAAGFQSGWNDFTYAATPATWGHDIEVPDISVNSENWVSPFWPVIDFIGVKDAKMLMPGAATLGCIK